jgi:pSer/pThr/pTyr-binding forkhead associated (FHA) protein
MWDYPLFDGPNIIGRAEERPVEIDLQPQEAEDRIFSSLQHACIDWDGHTPTVEDLGTINGTFLNSRGLRVGQKCPLKSDDIIRIGEVELQLIAGTPYQMARSSSRPGSGPRLLAVRGLQPAREYLIAEGRNIIGRGDQKPVEIDLQEQEPDYRVWVSRQHASITRRGDSLLIEDLFTANATYVNRRRVPPGVKRPLQEGDVIQVGEIQLKLVFQ